MKTSFFPKGIIWLCCLFMACQSQQEKLTMGEAIDLIPRPQSLTTNNGVFVLDEKTIYVLEIPTDFEKPYLLLNHELGFDLQTGDEEIPIDNFIHFKYDDTVPAEAYVLEITPKTVQIRASDNNGFIYAQETIRQLLPKEVEKAGAATTGKWGLPCVLIKDSPSYRWRGAMLDVSRHFFQKEYILKTIERLAFLKMNTLHLHLVDDQGWRIEIKKYPKLTEVGAFRVDQEEKHWNARSQNDPNEKGTYGGYYTQEDIREIVEHATKYGVNVVPEIEMPAHVMSAIASYPYLSCIDEPIAVPSGGVWPITDIYCPGKESTFTFLEGVLDEVIELFPSKYVHVGGDEATKDHWEKCPDCQKRMKEEGLANVEELQSYMIKRIEKYLNAKGKTLIGWDEILEGGLAPRATVMSWRGVEGGWKASQQGHDVVMTPTSHLYFDYFQGNQEFEPPGFCCYLPVSKVYDFDPVIDSMSVAQKSHVLGAQANLWSEYVDTEEHSEYMLFPRLLALSEVVWSGKKNKDWLNFAQRLKPMMHRLGEMEIRYAESVFNVNVETEVNFEDSSITLELGTEFPNTEIRYQLGDKELSSKSPIYNEPITLTTSNELKAAVFDGGEMKGVPLEKKFNFHRAFGKEVSVEPNPHEKYSGTGDVTLVDIVWGSKDFANGKWLGWFDENVKVTIDLGQSEKIHQVTVGTMENQGAGIYYPTEISVSTSLDGQQFDHKESLQRNYQASGENTLKAFQLDFKKHDARYIQVVLKPLQKNERGNGTWIFMDEVSIE
ncbi:MULTISPECIES: family 20 glycosylhydrolase [Flavobacteriaceae]|uniref:glycoside hydrolase family 20 protein n=1 Tax=Flavobacteriaceae TaxID=49546 RepID=UPI001FE5CF86|nr:MULTISPECIES: family 20 glycosylhydrolase [Allomuricauda]MDC6366234.1 family 20 glycosylhydrolase [Muricauda sp. AC10]